ncbi:MAG: hypothetical protein ACI35S_05765 [Anaeroplasma sp.]
MINEQENKTSLNKMSDLEYTKNDTEMMRYRVNGLSYKLGLFAMIFSLIAAFICLNTLKPVDFQIIIIILMNIILLLGGFLAAEKVKNYSKSGAFAQIVFGAVCIANIFYIPLKIIIAYGNYLNALALNVNDFESSEAFNEAYNKALNGADNILGATVTSKYSGTVANAFLPSSGYFRGIAAIVLFALAAGCFIAAGVIGYKRSVKLTTYLDSLTEKN